MQKAASLFAFIALFSTQVSADFISHDEAARIAADFFTVQGAEYSAQRDYTASTESEEANSVVLVYPEPQTRAMASGQELPSFYIFNRTEGNGFVIVSAETGMRQILAYSDEGIFHTDHMDRGAKPFLDSYIREVNGIRSGEIPRSSGSPVGAPRPDFKVLQTANFHQFGYSFNSNYAPEIDGKSCFAGCVATAMAIVMKYHNWPERGSGSFNYISGGILPLSFNFAANPFDWEAMSNTPDEMSSDAVSMLQKACGVSVAMVYGTEESGAFFGSIAYALRHYFYYDYPLHIIREYYDSLTWEQMLRDEIDADRPVLVGGNTYNGGHAFVLDGYNNTGMFHYNLGWGGDNNGYYSDGSISSYGFTLNEAIIGIVPRSDEEADFTSPITIQSSSTNLDANLVENSAFDFNAYGLWNLSNKSFNGLISVSIYDENLNWKYNIFRTYDQTEYPIPVGTGCYDIPFPYCYIPEGMELEPTDMVLLSTSTDGGQSWNPIYNKHSDSMIRHAGGYDTNLPRHSQIALTNDTSSLEIQGGSIIADAPFLLNVNSVHNYANTTYDGEITLAVCDTCDWSVIHVLSCDSISFSEAYDNHVPGDTIKYDDLIIPGSLSLKSSYALAIFTRALDSDTVFPICDSSYGHVFLMLSDYMDTTDGIISNRPLTEEAIIYTLDGRRMQEDAATHGLYLIQHEDGTVSKTYR